MSRANTQCVNQGSFCHFFSVIVQRRPAILSIDEDNATSDQVTYSLNYTLWDSPPLYLHCAKTITLKRVESKARFSLRCVLRVFVFFVCFPLFITALLKDISLMKITSRSGLQRSIIKKPQSGGTKTACRFNNIKIHRPSFHNRFLLFIINFTGCPHKEFVTKVGCMILSHRYEAFSLHCPINIWSS